MRRWIAVGLCYSFASAQQLSIDPVRPAAPLIVRPYLAPEVPPVRLANSPRLRELVRAGKLYLTAQDAIALALENNADLEVARYNAIASAWRVERAEAGGALPGVPSGASQAGSVASGQGVAGSQAAAGVSINGGNGTTTNTGNATISQIGPVTQTLDPSIQETTTFTHRSIPQPNIVQSVTPVLITNTRVYTGSLQQGLLSGGSVTLNYSNHYLNENSPTDLLNPSEAPNLSLSFQHNLLRGFGNAVNARNITVAKINLKTSDLNFRTQVIGVVVQVLNAYYTLVADYESERSKTEAGQVAQELLANNKRQVEIGSLAETELITTQSQVASTHLDVVLARTNLQTHELQLKNLLSRNSIADPVLMNAQIIPLDRIVIPEKEDLPPIQEMIQQALANRSDLAASKANLNTLEVSALGTRNGILPSLQVFGAESQAGLAGVPRIVRQGPNIQAPDPYFAGGVTDGLGQVFRRNFPTERIGTFLAVPLGNHQAQADFGIDQLQLRQSQLNNQKDLNQVGVDISNAAVALRQARVRYDAAVKNRLLVEELLRGEQEKFTLGASTPYNVIQQQRDLAAAKSTEVATLVSYSSARISLDETLGTTLERNNISLAEVRFGKISVPSH